MCVCHGARKCMRLSSLEAACMQLKTILGSPPPQFRLWQLYFWELNRRDHNDFLLSQVVLPEEEVLDLDSLTRACSATPGPDAFVL